MADTAEIKTLTNADGSVAIYPRTTVEAVFGLENIDSRVDSLETQLENIDSRVDSLETQLENKPSLDNNGKVLASQTSSAIKNIESSAYTLVAEDAGKFLRFLYAGDVTVTIPADTDCSIFPQGTELELFVSTVNLDSLTVRASNTEAVKFMASSGASLTSVAMDTSVNYGVMVLKRILSNRWLAKGDVE